MLRVELVYIIFLLSGLIKTYLTYFNIPSPIDFTIISSIPLIFYILYQIYLNKKLIFPKYAFRPFICLIILFIWILFSIIYSSSENFIFVKIAQYFTIIVAFTFPILYSHFNKKYFFSNFVYIVFILALIYIPIFQNSYIIYLTKNFANEIYMSYLTMGYICSVSIIINYFNSYKLYIKIPIFLILFYTLIITGARGPIIFLLLSFFLYYCYLFFSTKNYKKSAIRTISFAFLTFFILSTLNLKTFDSVFERTITRLNALNSIQGDESANSRLKYIEFINLKMDHKHFFQGFGFGSYGIEEIGKDIRHYPHNIILEIYFELGIIGIIIFLFFLFFMTRIIFISRNPFFSILFIFLLLNSLKSLSLVDSRIMFGLFSIFFITFITQKEQNL